MPHISFCKVPMCVLSRFFPPKMCWTSPPIHTSQKHWKDIESSYTPIKFESTLHTLDLNITRFPNVIKHNIQMKNTCPSEARSMNANFENNKKTLK
jgi:hypothetical protein